MKLPKASTLWLMNRLKNGVSMHSAKLLRQVFRGGNVRLAPEYSDAIAFSKGDRQFQPHSRHQIVVHT